MGSGPISTWLALVDFEPTNVERVGFFDGPRGARGNRSPVCISVDQFMLRRWPVLLWSSPREPTPEESKNIRRAPHGSVAVPR